MPIDHSHTVTVQARVPRELADSIPTDARILGLDGVSEAIREGLRMLHRRAELVALAQEYDEYYDGTPAPLSEATAAIFADE